VQPQYAQRVLSERQLPLPSFTIKTVGDRNRIIVQIQIVYKYCVQVSDSLNEQRQLIIYACINVISCDNRVSSIRMETWNSQRRWSCFTVSDVFRDRVKYRNRFVTIECSENVEHATRACILRYFFEVLVLPRNDSAKKIYCQYSFRRSCEISFKCYVIIFSLPFFFFTSRSGVFPLHNNNRWSYLYT